MEEAAVWTAIAEAREIQLENALEAQANRGRLARLLRRGEQVGFHTLLQDPVYNRAHFHLNRLGVESINLTEYDEQALTREGQ